MTTASANPTCDYLILDAGPLLSLSPLRGLAKTYLTVPQVLDELKDRRAREHFEQLGLSAGVKVEVRAPDAASLAQVAQAAKKTGDYSVLSHADLCVLALTYALEQSGVETAPEAVPPTSESVVEVGTPDVEPASDVGDLAVKLDAVSIEPSLTEHATEDYVQPIVEPQDTSIEDTPENSSSQPTLDDGASESAVIRDAPETEPIFDDPLDEDDGEGEWITPANVDIHKSRALDLLPDSGKNAKSRSVKHMNVACMTADFAMQNVLLHMGLNLVGVEGKRIDTVKTWVLRCHACFKICQDSTRKFCPSCGNPTLLRASVTVSAPRTPGGQATMQVHLKKNFQHRLRGTMYSIPAPKPGSAKTGTGEGLILREDQSAYARAAQKDASKRQREERKMMSNALERGAKGQQGGVVIGSWMDPDWVPEIMSVGAGGHGRSRGKGDMPTIGYGRKNPNERRRKK